MRCIAIDDEPIALNIISEFARRMGNISVETFTNPLKALEEIRRSKPDIVFIDIEMKGMNGLELARIISSDVMFIRQKDLQERARHAEEDFFIVKSEYKNIKISYADISFIEALNNYIKIHLNHERPVMTQMSMKNIEEILPESTFIRVHKSFIVNKTAIISFTKNDITLAGNHTIPIGRAYSANFACCMNGTGNADKQQPNESN